MTRTKLTSNLRTQISDLDESMIATFSHLVSSMIGIILAVVQIVSKPVYFHNVIVFVADLEQLFYCA